MKKLSTSDFASNPFEQMPDTGVFLLKPRSMVIKNIMDYVRATRLVHSKMIGDFQFFKN